MPTEHKERKTRSIRSQLLFGLITPIVGLCLLSAGISYEIAIHIARDAYDAALLESAREVANRVHFKNGLVSVDFPPEAVALMKEDNTDQFYYAVFDYADREQTRDQTLGRTLIAGDPVMPRLKNIPHSLDDRYFSNGVIGANPVRIASLSVPVPGRNNTVTVQVAETMRKRQSLANVILIAVVLPQIVLIASAAAVVWAGVASGLKPLQAVASAIAKRSQWDLSPVSNINVPGEIRPLVSALNDLLTRLNRDIEAQRRFVSNAAHQLRTPLAGLKTQTEFALRQEDSEILHHALEQMHNSTARIARLVNQLLSLARMEPSVAREHSKLDLNPIAAEATAELVPFAVNKEIDLGFEDSVAPALIKGDAEALRELVSNLIDNAIRYTQPKGKVTVRVYANEGIHLHVEDDGPGIPAAEKEKVFERFYRVLGTNVSGSGLGLSIVKEIAQAHSANVSIRSLNEEKGTIVDVKFPAQA